MPIIQKQNDLTKFIDLSEGLKTVKLQSTLTADLGFFSEKPLSTKTVFIPRTIESLQDLQDVQWGLAPQTLGADSKGYMTLPVARFPVKDAIFPADLDGNFNWDEIGQGQVPETLTSVRSRKMAKIGNHFTRLLETARMQLIISGTGYAPNGMLAQSYGSTVDYYQEFGITRQNFEMSLNAPTEDILPEVEPIIAYVQDNLNNGTVAGQFVAICGKTFFSKLVSHPYVKDAGKYINFSQSEDLLMGRLSAKGLGLDNRYRAFSFGGVVWIEDRSQMPALEARLFPTDVPEMFVTYYAPSEMKFGTVNTTARDIYYFEKMTDENGQERFEVVAESNFLNACLRPQALVSITIKA
jgi:hypothetical protein